MAEVSGKSRFAGSPAGFQPQASEPSLFGGGFLLTLRSYFVGFKSDFAKNAVATAQRKIENARNTNP